MERPTKAEAYRTQARICAAMAQTAPTTEIMAHWLALAESYQKAAAALDRAAPSREAERRQ